MKIAVVMTTYNRKEKSILCVKTLLLAAQKTKYSCDLSFYICDDVSLDGTPEELQKNFNEIHLISSTGDLFWAKGMARAMTIAEKSGADFYLMMNDDVECFETLFDSLFNTYYQAPHQCCAIVGSTKSKVDGSHTYGGSQWNVHKIQNSMNAVFPKKELQECNRANWNCFLLPADLYEIVGPIDDFYEHGTADYDYSLRLTKEKYKMYVAEEYIGYCERNSPEGTWLDVSLPFLKRVKLLIARNAYPLKGTWHFSKKCYGCWAWIFFVKNYVQILLPKNLFRGKNQKFNC